MRGNRGLLLILLLTLTLSISGCGSGDSETKPRIPATGPLAAASVEQCKQRLQENKSGTNYKQDSDNDGIPDYNELFGSTINGSVVYTNPFNPDSDGDGRSDGEEASATNKILKSSELLATTQFTSPSHKDYFLRVYGTGSIEGNQILASTDSAALAANMGWNFYSDLKLKKGDLISVKSLQTDSDKIHNLYNPKNGYAQTVRAIWGAYPNLCNNFECSFDTNRMTLIARPSTNGFPRTGYRLFTVGSAMNDSFTWNMAAADTITDQEDGSYLLFKNNEGAWISEIANDGVGYWTLYVRIDSLNDYSQSAPSDETLHELLPKLCP